MSPGSLSFAKLMMMSSTPAKSARDHRPDTRPKIHSFNQRCPIQSRLQSVLAVRSTGHVERNEEIEKRVLQVKIIILFRTIFYIVQGLNNTIIIHLYSVFSQWSKNASQKGNYNYKLPNYVYYKTKFIKNTTTM